MECIIYIIQLNQVGQPYLCTAIYFINLIKSFSNERELTVVGILWRIIDMPIDLI